MTPRFTDVFQAMPGVSRVATVAAAIAVAVLIWAGNPLFAAIFSRSLPELTNLEADPATVDEFKNALARRADFAVDRSLFLVPSLEQERPVDETTDERPTPPPRTYGGPKLVGLLDDRAIFDGIVVDGKNALAVGQRGGSVELLAIQAPWHVRVRWSGSEWTLNLFDDMGSVGGPAAGGDPNQNLFGAPGGGSGFENMGLEDGELFQPVERSGPRTAPPRGDGTRP